MSSTLNFFIMLDYALHRTWGEESPSSPYNRNYPIGFPANASANRIDAELSPCGDIVAEL